MAIKRRRRKGTGCLVNRNGIYYARWTANGIVRLESTGFHEDDVKVLPNGRRASGRELAEAYLMDRTEPLRMRHREDALAIIERQLMDTEDRLRLDIEGSRRNPMVADLADMFERSTRRPDCSRDMMAFYKRVIGKFAAFAGPGIPLSEVTEAMSGRYASAISKGMAAGTFNKAMNALTLVWKCVGKDMGLPPDANPWADITRRKPDTKVRACFTDAEVKRILDNTTGEQRTLWAIGFFTGLRLGDAVHLKWDNIRGDEVFVKTAKTGAQVAIPLHPRLATIIGKRRKSGLVVPGLAAIYDDPKRSSHVNRILKRTLDAVGIQTSYKGNGERSRPRCGFHSCRVFFISSAIAAGVPIDVVRGIVGHTEVRMTEHYFRVESDAAMDAFRRMAPEIVNQ